MAPLRNITIVGASGNVGLPITLALAASPAKFALTALTRLTSSPSPRLPPSVRILRADYNDKAALVEAFRGQDAVVCTIGSTSNTLQDTLIDAAAEAGVRRFIPSHFAFDHLAEKDGLPLSEIIPVGSLKEAPVKKIEDLRAAGSKMEWTAVVTGPWVDFVREIRASVFASLLTRSSS